MYLLLHRSAHSPFVSHAHRKGEAFVGAKKPAVEVDPGVSEVVIVGADMIAPDAVAQLRSAAALPFVRVAAGVLVCAAAAVAVPLARHRDLSAAAAGSWCLCRHA